jgi:hypothetical protein
MVSPRFRRVTKTTIAAVVTSAAIATQNITGTFLTLAKSTALTSSDLRFPALFLEHCFFRRTAATVPTSPPSEHVSESGDSGMRDADLT